MLNLADVLPLGGCGLRYSDSAGEGRPVVFLHGAGADHTLFDGYIAAGESILARRRNPPSANDEA